MYFVNIVHFCILYFPCVFGRTGVRTLDLNDDNLKLAGKMTLIGQKPDDQLDVKRYQAELAAGDHSEFLGSNPHLHESTYFTDLGRRFVPVYPYKHKPKLQKNLPEEIFQYIQSSKKGKKIEDRKIIPIMAPPEIVLAVMKNAKKMDTAKLSDPTEEVIREYMLRSGNLKLAGKMTLIGQKPDDQLDVKRYQAELAAGDHSEFLGSNPHLHESTYFTDLGRRFVPVYPYKHKPKLQKNLPEEIFQYIQSSKKGKKIEDRKIIPIMPEPKARAVNMQNGKYLRLSFLPPLAPPEIVLAVMKNAKKMDTAKLSDPTEEVIREYMLRSGDYWDGVVKEEVDPDFILRTNKKHKQEDDEEDELFQDSQPIPAKLLPGTKLYDLIAEIVKKAPKLVYIINDK